MEQHGRGAYPNECCGLVWRKPQKEKAHRIRNMQDEMHARDPARFPRTARIAYYMDPQALLQALRIVDQGVWRVAAIYHSHPDHGAYFSEEDRDRAMFGGDPLYPGTAYVVLSVNRGAIEGMKAFRWDRQKKDFVEAAIVPRSARKRDR
jgi:proteasome lid subunit RPN8/RPN11